jgi:alkyl hydroperoxide reductase subunit AhpF
MFLSDSERSAVSKILAGLSTPVRLLFFEQSIGCESCRLTRQLLDQIAELSDRSREQLRRVSKAVDVKVFFTPACVYCPQMTTLANGMAVESPLVRATAIDATEYPDLVRRYNVNGVPKTVINDTVGIVGVASEDDLIAAIC